MARRARLRLGGVAVHLIQRGVDRQACFFAVDDRARYLAELGELAPRHGCALHAYVLMTNHVHLLLTPEDAAGPSKLMQRLGRRYVRGLNDVYGRSGTLWEGRFRSCIAEDEGYVLACYRYIELNPVRARMVADPLEYPWSSHAANARGPDSPLLTPHPQLLSLGPDPASRRAAYRTLFDEVLDADAVGAIRDATNGNYVLGSERFRDQIAEMLGRRVTRGTPAARATRRRAEREIVVWMRFLDVDAISGCDFFPGENFWSFCTAACRAALQFGRASRLRVQAILVAAKRRGVARLLLAPDSLCLEEPVP